MAMRTFTLFLSPPQDSGPQEYEYVLADAGLGTPSLGRSAAPLLPRAQAQGAECVAVLPTQCVSWHAVTLPPNVARMVLQGRTEGARMRSVLGGAMEDQLLAAPESLHFAAFPGAPLESEAAPNAAVSLWVAVCDLAWLQAHLHTLESVGIVPARLVAQAEPSAPLTSAGPALEDPPRLAVDASLHPAAVVASLPRGVMRLPLSPATAMLLHAENIEEMVAEPALVPLAQDLLGPTVQVQSRAQGLLRAARSQRNLAQGALAGGAPQRLGKSLAHGWQQFRHGNAWKPARWTLAALLALQVLALNVVAALESANIKALKVEQSRLLQSTFPAVTLVIDAPLQMEREVKALAQDKGQATPVNTLWVLQRLAEQAPEGQPLNSITLADGALSLQGVRLPPSGLQAFQAALQTRGLQLQGGDGPTLVVRKGAP